MGPGPGSDLQTAEWALSFESFSENSQDWFPVSLGGGVHFLHDFINKLPESVAGHLGFISSKMLTGIK